MKKQARNRPGETHDSSATACAILPRLGPRLNRTNNPLQVARDNNQPLLHLSLLREARANAHSHHLAERLDAQVASRGEQLIVALVHGDEVFKADSVQIFHAEYTLRGRELGTEGGKENVRVVGEVLAKLLEEGWKEKTKRSK